jgi:hypothetical protein
MIIIIKEIFTFAHKFNLKDPPPSDWLVLASSNEIAFVKIIGWRRRLHHA